MAVSEQRERELAGESLAYKAMKIQAEALERGENLTSEEALRQVREGGPNGESKTAAEVVMERAKLLLFQADRRGEALSVSEAYELARNPESQESISRQARQERFQTEEAGWTISPTEALERAKRYCAAAAAALPANARR